MTTVPKLPLLSTRKEVFTRGKYEFQTLDEVARKDPEYLIFIVEQSETDQGTIGYIQEWIEQNPSYFEEV